MPAPQGGRVDPGVFERIPGGLQQQPLLRIHRQRLTRTDPEEPRVEARRVGEEPALTNVGLPRRVRVEQAVQVPAPVGGELPHHVRTRRQEVPQGGRAVHASGQPQSQTDDGDGLVRDDLHRGDDGVSRGETGHLGEQVVSERGGRGVVEHQRRRQGCSGQSGETVAQLDRRQ